jgi:hypothetical protein
MTALILFEVQYAEHATNGKSYITDAIMVFNGNQYPCECVLEDCDKPNEFVFDDDDFGTFKLLCVWIGGGFDYEVTRRGVVLPDEFYQVDDQDARQTTEPDDPVWVVLGHNEAPDSDSDSD